ncbi:MAG: protein-L-isoaspartate(D-aspartate) O-methyltransferase [Trueperaceae bacterium]|nr:MAG: protein-L-isoaspartate(D-aspartate) O-methyltransferase [Trueperaceae bacterium]
MLLTTERIWRLSVLALTFVALSTWTPTTTAQQSTEVDGYSAERDRMVQTGIIDWGISDSRVIEVMRAVPRHAFVPPEYLRQAYENHPLPIGYGQTISQPYIVALMTQAVGVESGDTVLEIGTGSGYQAAVLAELAEHVYSLEIIEALADRAGDTLRDLGYDNVTIHHQDGYFGIEDKAPFDAIVVTAAPDHIPQPLVQQLEIGGRMVIPVGPVGGYQTLWLLTRTDEEEIQAQNLGGVRFVPLTRRER